MCSPGDGAKEQSVRWPSLPLECPDQGQLPSEKLFVFNLLKLNWEFKPFVAGTLRKWVFSGPSGARKAACSPKFTSFEILKFWSFDMARLETQWCWPQEYGSLPVLPKLRQVLQVVRGATIGPCTAAASRRISYQFPAPASEIRPLADPAFVHFNTQTCPSLCASTHSSFGPFILFLHFYISNFLSQCAQFVSFHILNALTAVDFEGHEIRTELAIFGRDVI